MFSIALCEDGYSGNKVVGVSFTKCEDPRCSLISVFSVGLLFCVRWILPSCLYTLLLSQSFVRGSCPVFVIHTEECNWLRKRKSCFNHRVVTLVADKLKR